MPTPISLYIRRKIEYLATSSNIIMMHQMRSDNINQCFEAISMQLQRWVWHKCNTSKSCIQWCYPKQANQDAIHNTTFTLYTVAYLMQITAWYWGRSIYKVRPPRDNSILHTHATLVHATTWKGFNVERSVGLSSKQWLTQSYKRKAKSFFEIINNRLSSISMPWWHHHK